MIGRILILALLLSSIGLQADAASGKAESDEASRLVFAMRQDDACLIKLWRPASGQLRELAKLPGCPEDLFLSPDGSAVFFVHNGAVHRRPFDASHSIPAPVTMPDMDVRSWEGQATIKPHIRDAEYMASFIMKPHAIGYLADGTVAMQAQMWQPADGSSDYLLVYVDGEWAFEGEMYCDKWDERCVFEELDGYSATSWGWQVDREIWRPSVQENSYFVRERREAVDLKYENYQAGDVWRYFQVDGRNVELYIATSPSEHSDSDHMFTINLTIDDQPTKNLSDRQCMATLVGRHLLVYRYFGGGKEVTDIGTGESVFGPLEHALWFN